MPASGQPPAILDPGDNSGDFQFNPNPQIESFPVGADRRRVDIQLLNDDIAEGDEYFDLRLTLPGGDTTGEQARIITEGQVTRFKIEAGDGTQGKV